MPVVVTGAAGFLGSAVVAELVRRGDRVVAIDRRPAGRTGVGALRADLCDGDAEVRAVLRDADAVIHLAGCPGVRDQCPDVALRRHRDNVLATRAVLAGTPYPVPVVVASSSSVYGDVRPGRASRETDPVCPRGGYAESKRRMERLCLPRLACGAPVVVARPFTAVGEGQRPDMALARWIGAACAGRPLQVFGGLDRTRDFTDVRDVARALIALVGCTGIVNVGTGTPRTLGALIAAVGQVLGEQPEVVVLPAPVVDVSHTWADPTRLTQFTGLRPATDLPAVVARAADSLLLAAA